VRAVYAPPIVDEDIEYAQNNYQESGRPFCLEANSYHGARSKTNYRCDKTSDTPFSLNHVSKEEEYQQYTPSEEETVMYRGKKAENKIQAMHVLFFAIRLTH